MAFQLLLLVNATTLLLIITIIFIVRRLRMLQILEEANKPDPLQFKSCSPESGILSLSRSLALALPDSVIFPHDVVAFKQSIRSYWAQQECEVSPVCVVQPRDVQQLRTAVKLLKHEYDKRRQQSDEGRGLEKGLFAVRGGGHSPVSGAASIDGGVLIDLSRFCKVVPSEDGTSVAIGAGAKWIDVSRVLDERGLAVVGGRNSAVGVGGLTLGGKNSLLILMLVGICLRSRAEGKLRRSLLLLPSFWHGML